MSSGVVAGLLLAWSGDRVPWDRGLNQLGVGIWAGGGCSLASFSALLAAHSPRSRFFSLNFGDFHAST